MIEVGPREMVIALGAVVALATTLQIMRRIRNSRYENIQMPNKKNDFIANEDQEATEWSDVDRSEFPSGGARIVTRDDNNLEAKINPDNSININHSTLNIDSSYHSDLEQKELKAHRKKSINDANSGHNYSANSIVVLHLEAKENKVFHGERLLNILLNSAKKIATELDGDLKDDSRSAFTKQTEDHYRQRIIDFNRIQIPGI